MATLTNASGRALECKFLYFRDRHRSVMAVGEAVTTPAGFLTAVTNRYKPRLRRAYAAAVAGGLVTYAESMQQAPENEPVAVTEESVVTAPVVEETAAEVEPTPVVEENVDESEPENE